MVVCGPKQFKDDKKDTLLNPVLIIEVLSPTTEGYDRGEKFRLYRGIESLQEYLLIDSQRYTVEKYQKNPQGGWVLTDSQDVNSFIPLSSIDFKLYLQDVYAQEDDITI